MLLRSLNVDCAITLLLLELYYDSANVEIATEGSGARAHVMAWDQEHRKTHMENKPTTNVALESSRKKFKFIETQDVRVSFNHPTCLHSVL